MAADVIVIGAGIVGLATANAIRKRWRDRSCLVLEKEAGPARHQSGRNSGVIHAGVYYQPGSLKARLCREGAAETYAFCREHGIEAARTGKLVVASDAAESTRLRALLQRCRQNGLDPRWLNGAELRDLEPEVAGCAAILVEQSGITDFSAICRALCREFLEGGGRIRYRTPVTGISERDRDVEIRSGERVFRARQLVVCGGLMADRLARLQGLRPRFRIVPYRGRYYRLREAGSALVSRLIYPVPDPSLPFLGVHLTPTVDGGILVGPNAVQAFAREGYGAFSFSGRDTFEMLAFSGFWKLTAAHLGRGLRELRNAVWKRGYLRDVQKFCPALRLQDLGPHPPGVRAQAVLEDGTMVHDFLFEETPRSLHVCNAPSPAATSALPIGRHICERLAQKAL